MSVIAPKFRLGYFLKAIIDNALWILVIITLIGVPLIQVALIYINLPVIEGELLTPFLAFTLIFHPELAVPLVEAIIRSDLFRIAAFPGFGFAALMAAAVIFVERKMLAKLQLRVGPFYCGKIEGIFQLIADGIKLVSKEIIIPDKADKPIFWVAPLLFVGAAAAFVALIPVAPGGEEFDNMPWVVADLDVGLIAVFAVIGFFPIITVLSAWSSNSKYPFIGGIRALHQMVSFEIPLILSLLGVVILTGTLNLNEIVQSQTSFPWILFLPVGAIVFFVAMLAELERIPFDLPEAESEIVAGWLTEFSGMMYGLVQLGSYVKLYAFAALFVTIFLAGYNGPSIYPDFPQDIIDDGIIIPGMTGPLLTVKPFTDGTAVLDQEMINGLIWFVLKTAAVIFFILLIRGVFPRVRIDMLLHIGWYKLIGLAFVNIFIALGLLYSGILAPVGAF